MSRESADSRFPIGPFVLPATVSERERARWIDDLARQPTALREAVHGLSAAQLATPYREGGWTVRQVAHHLVDSQLQGYTRFKLALTEDNPTIKPYREAAWAELADTATVPLEVSVQLATAVLARWLAVLAAMGEKDWKRTFFHPERGIALTLEQALANYSWHGRHHVAHVTVLRRRMGW